jgi:FkbM family methyltransferase
MTLEWFRRIVRERLGYRSRPYRLASRLLTDGTTIAREGAGTFFILRKIRRSQASPRDAVPVRFRSLDHPILIRPGTCDLGAAVDNLVRLEYGRYPPRDAPRVLVDGGAYIGDTSAFFLSRYPGLTAWSLEPDATSFAAAVRNIAPYGTRAHVLQSALCAVSGQVCVSGTEIAARVGSGSGTTVPAITIEQLLEIIPEKFIDILKLDIEGAETEIFEHSPERWLPFVGMIIVETHGPESSRAMEGAMRNNGWSIRRYRNLYYCWPER